MVILRYLQKKNTNINEINRNRISKNYSHRLKAGDRMEGEGGRVVCTCLDMDIRSANFFCFLKTSILKLGMVEHLKVRQNCHRIENYYFQFILKIWKKIVLSDLILKLYNRNKCCQKCHFDQH